MLSRYSDFILESLLLRLDESVIYYSDEFIETLTRMNTDLSKKILGLSQKDLDTDVNYISTTDSPEQLSFIPDARGELMVQKLTPPDNDNVWKRVELVDASRVYDYFDSLFELVGEEGNTLPAPSVGTLGWARLVKNPKQTNIDQKFWHFKADLDDPIFIEDVRRSKEDTNYDPVKQDSFYAHDEYTAPFRFIDPYKDLTKISKNRNPIKIGRLIKRLLQVSGYEATDKEVEEFVNKYKSTFTIMKDKFRNFELVGGEDIKHHYLFSNNAGKGGTLGSSCMRYAKCQDYLNIYAENSAQIQLLVLTDPLINKTIGRALVWNAKLKGNQGQEQWEATDITFMDRIYTHLDSDVNQFIEYAKEKGWSYKEKQHSSEFFNMITPDGNIENPTLIVSDLNVDDGGEFPYVDTIKYLNAYTYKMSTNKKSINSKHSDIYKLESQEGTNGYCEVCGGDGTVECYDCGGDGSESCQECDGEGKHECSYCEGSGIDPDERNEDESEKECEHCDGEGYAKCEECGGEGDVDCSSCDGEGHTDCQECN